MRIDKYLKVSRLIKRRTVACAACESGRVCINDKVAKPSSIVNLEDIIQIQFGDRLVKVQVKSISVPSSKIDPKELYEILG